MQQQFKQAQQLHQQNKLAQAEQLYRQTVQRAPHFAEAKHLLGLVCSQQGRHAEGADWILQAIRKQPAYPPYYNNLGLVYVRQKDWKKAEQAYHAATRIAPDFAEAWFNAANANKALGRQDKAINFYKKAIKKAPKHARAMYNLGNLLLETGKPKSARTWFERALEVRPDYAEAHNNLGSALDAWKEHERAFAHYQRAHYLKPDLRDAQKNLGNAYLRRGEYEPGRTLIADYLKKQETTDWNELALASLSPLVFSDNNHIDQWRAALTDTLQRYQSTPAGIDLSNLHEQMLEPSANMPYQGRDVREIKTLYGQLFGAKLPQPTRSATPQRSGKPRVGFVVTNGHEGVFLKCMRGILNQFDTARFEVFVVCSQPHGEEILAPQIVNPQVRFLSIPSEIDRAAEVILRANFDVLHYWEVGTDVQNYFLPFFRLAPVQCTSWGWPVTSGIPQMDYFLSSEGLETPEADTHYTEQLIRFKKIPTYYYQPRVPTTPVRMEDYGLPGGVPVYLCAQNLRKVHPDFDLAVKSILEQDPAGIVVFIHDAQPNITELLRKRLTRTCGDYADRLHFLSRMSAEKYLSLLSIVDIILDTFYYTGGANTAYDAFAAGTPYVTLPWTFHRGRFGAAAYRQIGVEDLIASDVADYVNKAIRTANDPDFRAGVSQKIRMHAHRVFEDTEAVRELENFFAQAVISHREKYAKPT